MMRIFLFVMSLICFSAAWADDPPVLTRVYFYNPEMRYERDDTTQEIVNRNPRGYGLGFKMEDWALVFETSSFTETSGNDTLSLYRTHQEGTVWVRRHFFNQNFGAVSGSVYLSAGLGGYQEKVVTTLSGESDTDTGRLQPMGGVAAGVEVVAVAIDDMGLVAGFEVRGLAGNDFDPSPMFSALMQFGLQF